MAHFDNQTERLLVQIWLKYAIWSPPTEGNLKSLLYLQMYDNNNNKIERISVYTFY